MGRLSTIEDIEQRASQQEAQAAAQRQEQGQAARQAAAQAAAPQQEDRPQQAAPVSAAQREAEFHGLDTHAKRDGGHTALIVAAVVIVAAAALYIANYSLHFF